MVDLLPSYAATVRSSPTKPCVAEGAWRLTYAEVDALSDNIANDLQASGASVGDVVCFLGGAGARRLIFLLACLKAGYCFSSPILQMGEAQTVEFSEVVRPRIIMVEDGCEDLAGMMTADAVIPYTTNIRDHGQPATCDMPLTAASFISFTSGSTGKPKGMRRSRAALQYFVGRGVGLQTLTPDDTMALLGNLWCPTMLTGFAAGASIVCYDTPRLGGVGLADWLIAERATTSRL